MSRHASPAIPSAAVTSAPASGHMATPADSETGWATIRAISARGPGRRAGRGANAATVIAASAAAVVAASHQGTEV